MAELPPLVLITGATGHIGFKVLLEALAAGYRVRCAVRSAAKGVVLLQHPLIAPLAPRTPVGPDVSLAAAEGDGTAPAPRVSVAIVPDIATPGAYSAAIVGCTYAIHVASALASNLLGEDPSRGEELLVRPAVAGTMEMLYAAQAVGSVRRVVITSSIVTIIPDAVWQGTAAPTPAPYAATARNPINTAGPFGSVIEAYVASKVAALREAEVWMAAAPRGFDVVHVHPGFTFGPNGLSQTHAEAVRGTNTIAMNAVLGLEGFAVAGSCCHVDDVAAMHVRALTHAFGLAAAAGCVSLPVHLATELADSVAIARKHFPAAVADGRLPLGGVQVSFPGIHVDLGLSEQVLGRALQPYEAQVVDMIRAALAIEPARPVPGAVAEEATAKTQTLAKAEAEAKAKSTAQARL